MSGLLRFKIIMTENGISPRLDDAGDWVRHSDVADMYEALRMVMQHGRIDDSEHRMNVVAAALAKAEGRADD